MGDRDGEGTGTGRENLWVSPTEREREINAVESIDTSRDQAELAKRRGLKSRAFNSRESGS